VSHVLLLTFGLLATADAAVAPSPDAGTQAVAPLRAPAAAPSVDIPSPRKFARDTDALVDSLERSQTENAGFSLLYVLSITLVIVIGIFLLRHLLLRIPALHKHRAQNMAVESQLAIDPKNRLVIAQVEGQRLLLGVSDSGGITLLRDLPERAEEHGG
jgi:flagellar biogenesis protein FliO